MHLSSGSAMEFDDDFLGSMLTFEALSSSVEQHTAAVSLSSETSAYIYSLQDETPSCDMGHGHLKSSFDADLPFKCNLCSKSFPKRKTFSRHLKYSREHSRNLGKSPPDVACTECGKVISARPDILQRHFRRKHLIKKEQAKLSSMHAQNSRSHCGSAFYSDVSTIGGNELSSNAETRLILPHYDGTAVTLHSGGGHTDLPVADSTMFQSRNAPAKKGNFYDTLLRDGRSFANQGEPHLEPNRSLHERFPLPESEGSFLAAEDQLRMLSMVDSTSNGFQLSNSVDDGIDPGLLTQLFPTTDLGTNVSTNPLPPTSDNGNLTVQVPNYVVNSLRRILQMLDNSTVLYKPTLNGMDSTPEENHDTIKLPRRLQETLESVPSSTGLYGPEVSHSGCSRVWMPVSRNESGVSQDRRHRGAEPMRHPGLAIAYTRPLSPSDGSAPQRGARV